MVLYNRISAIAHRLTGLKLKLSLLALGQLTLLMPVAAGAQTTFTGGGSISLTSTQTTSSSSTLSISGAPAGSSIASLKIILNGVTSDGESCGDCWSLQTAEFYLQAPNGGPTLELLGNVGDGTDGDDLQDSGSGLKNATITIEDGATAAPNSAPISPQGGPFTFEPSGYFQGNGQTTPLGAANSWPQSDGSATLNHRFGGTAINNNDKWTLTIVNLSGYTTPISISSWEMIVTYAVTTPTTTTVSASSNPGLTGNSVTFTATVSPASGPTGSVTFTDNGTTICSAVALSSGVAHCAATLAQGYHPIEATYAGNTSYGQSSGSLTELIEVTPTHTAGSSTWCDNTSFSAVLNGTPIAYPAMIPVSGYANGSTVGNVTLELEGVTEGAAGAGIEAQFLLVAPGGTHNLDFLDSAFNTESTSAVNLYIADSATLSPNYGTPTTNDTYLPFDGNTQASEEFPASNSPIVDSNIPSVPGTINYAAPHGKTNALTLQQAFSGALANGDWALYATASNGSDALTVGGWCVTLDVNSGIGTTTSLSSSQQDAYTGNSVTLTATVTVNGGSTPVTSGTVEFEDQTTGTVLSSAVAVNGSGQAAFPISTLAEGDHKIVASYSGTTNYDTSFANMYQRIDDATAVTTVNTNTWQFCNSGKITLPMGTNGAETPNPSNLFVSNLPGTLKTATLTLTNFSIAVGDQLDNTESLVVGPTGTALDFFSNTAGGTIGDEAIAGNYTFEDGASALVPSGSGNIGPSVSGGTVDYKPTSYVGTDNSNDVFTANVGGFFTLPGTFGYAASRSSSTFNSEFGGINPNGTWSLYFNSPNANANGTGAAGGWCMDLTENQPTVTVTLPNTSAFTQGKSNAQLTVNITNSGTTGPTGDPTHGSDPLTVTETLNSAFTFDNTGAGSWGTGWSCSASGQTVTCTNDSAVADNGGTYPELTIGVNVSPTATGTIATTVSASGAGVSSTTSNTDTITIYVAPIFTSATSSTFTAGTNGSFTVTTTGTPSATLSESGALPSGVTFTNNGNGTATIAGTPAASSGGSYTITITADNSTTNTTQTFTLTIDQAPLITSPATATFSVGVAGSFTVTASGYPAATTFSESGALPSGVTFSSAGVLSGTPAAGTGASYPITITANNGIGTAATQSFTLAVNQAPTFNLGSTGGVTMGVNTQNSYLIFTTGFPTAAITEQGTLPTGVTFVDNGNGHGTLSGDPAVNTGGLYNLVFTASNGVSPNATLNYTLTVTQPITFTSTAGTTFTTGAPGSFAVTATGYPTPTFSETGALPTGVTFSSAGVLSGTPAAGTGGNYSITIQATNGLSTPSQNFTLTVDQSPSIISAGNTTFVAGTAGTFTVMTTGYPTSALSESGSLPSGVTFTDNGNGMGTLAGTTASSGSFPISIIANNGVSPTANQSFMLTVNVPQYSLTTTGVPAAGGTVTPASGSLFNQGTVVSIVATPATGYTFVAWASTADPLASATSASTTITVNGTESVTAQFAPNLVVNTNADDAGAATNCSVQPTPGTTSNADTCSLRDALLNAAGAGAGGITFDSSVFASSNTRLANTINLSNSTLTIPSNTTITGPTSGSAYTLANLVTVAGGGASSDFPVFTVNSSATNSIISGLAISNGNSSGNGGGIVNGYGAGLTVINSTISGNTAASGTGGIFNDYNATLTVIGSTIAGNTGSYGGIVNESSGVVTMISSTIAGNTGPGISSIGTSVTIEGSTISGNTGAYSGGGITNSSGTLTLANSIVAGNSATTNPDVNGAYTDNGGNFIPGVNSATLASINLGPLGSYGGPTNTELPLPGSSALCGGTLTNAVTANVTADERGLPFDSACPSGSVDSGAVQANYALAFTTEPPLSGFIGTALSPAPVVTLTESGTVFAPATNGVTVSDSATLLGGTTTASLSSGSATFSNLVISGATSGDTLTASLSLNPNLSPALNLVSPASAGVNVESGSPAITSVSQILPLQTQTITIAGSGFGSQAPFTGTSSYIELTDNSGTPWAAGHTGNGVTLAVSSWTDAQIVLSGLSGSYGTSHCIRPGDQLSISIWNAQTGNGPAVYPIVAGGGTDHCPTTITSVSSIVSQQTQTITITGAGFGTQAAYTGNSNYIEFADESGSPWYAGETGNGVALVVSSWTDKQIVLGGFSGPYGTNHCVRPGDHLSISVWNAQTSTGPAVYKLVASSGTDNCPTEITSVSPIISQQTQTITITGAGFGTQTAYTGDSNYIELADNTGTWYAGQIGNTVTLAVSSWTDTQIVIAGLDGNYNPSGHCIRPGDQLTLSVWNAQTGAGPARFPIVASGGTDMCATEITSVSPILPQQTQTFTITGAGFGTQAAYSGDSDYIELVDSTGTWFAGQPGNMVGLSVSSWSDTQIVITGLPGAYGTNNWCISPGDQLYIKVWNAQTGAGPATYPIVAGSGANSCTL